MATHLNDLGSALTDQIYQSVIGGDENLPPPKDTFLTWAMPGLPLTADDLDFAADGIFSAPTAEEQNKRAMHAYSLSRLLDFVPDPDAPFSSERQEGMFKPDAEIRLSEIYRQILRFSKVADFPLTEAQQAKLDRFRGHLWTTKTVTDLITDEEKQVTEASPVMQAYHESMSRYLDAATEYNAKRAAAAGATGPEGKTASADFILNRKLYALKVKQAADEWTSRGYRNEVDDMNAFINQTTQRSLKLWKQQLLERYEESLISTADVGEDFPYTTLVPGNVARSRGWTRLGVSHHHKVTHRSDSTTTSGGGGGLGFFLFRVGADGKREETREFTAVGEFSMEFEMAQAIIVRAGFSPEFLVNRGWTLRRGEGWTFDQMPSDGGRPPQGSFIGYPTQVIFVRNVTIRSREFVETYRKLRETAQSGMRIGWGPLTLYSNRKTSTSEQEWSSQQDDASTLRVNGMQIVAFVNHLLGKTPNPLPELKEEDFV